MSKNNDTTATVIAGIIVAVLGFIFFAALGIGAAMSTNLIPWWLWNHVVAGLFGLPHVGFWQCFGICMFVGFTSKLIFGRK